MVSDKQKLIHHLQTSTKINLEGIISGKKHIIPKVSLTKNKWRTLENITIFLIL